MTQFTAVLIPRHLEFCTKRNTETHKTGTKEYLWISTVYGIG